MYGIIKLPKIGKAILRKKNEEKKPLPNSELYYKATVIKHYGTRIKADQQNRTESPDIILRCLDSYLITKGIRALVDERKLFPMESKSNIKTSTLDMSSKKKGHSSRKIKA